MRKQINNQYIQSLSGLVILLGGGVLLGTLIAPHVFNGLLYLSRTFTMFEGWRDIEFEKVGNRCVLISVLMALIPALYINDLLSLKALGMCRFADGFKACLIGIATGFLSMVILFVSGLFCGAFALPESLLVLPLLKEALYMLLGALIVGGVEEIIFRGALFGILRRGFGVISGAIIAGLIFAAVHFADPESPSGVVYGHWNAGLHLIRYMFTSHDFIPHMGFMFSTLLFMGIMLCFFYVVTGNLYFGIGLHASWVWTMRMGALLFIRTDGVYPMLFGPSMTVVKSGVALFISVFFLIVAILLYMRKVRR